MATAAPPETKLKTLQDPRLKDLLQQLRRTDNYTNLYYLLRTYLYLTAVLGGTIWFYLTAAEMGLSWWWNVPVTLLAIILVGAGQHQLTGLAHEASHHILFRNRYLNELVSDWFCMFPLFSTTHQYRLQHIAHHQFVNDPERDPDISQLQTSGHWLRFPLGPGEFARTLLKQLWLPNLFRYMRVRASYNAIPTDKNPYIRKGWKPNKLLVRVGILYMVGLVGLLAALVWLGDPLLLAVLPVLPAAAVLTFYALVPEDRYHQSRIHPLLSARTTTLLRVLYITLLFNGLAWLSLLVTPWVAVWFLVLWVVPIFTSFSFFMILRQLVQHGNGDRGWLTNTRVFLINYCLNFAIFPMGQDYHLPHHLFASVPHYHLRRLHEALLEYPEYREQAVVVEGYFLPRHRPPTKPTVVMVLGRDYAPRQLSDIYIDNDVLEQEQVEDKADILRQGEEEVRRRRAQMAAAGESAN
jgi:fatty acid desaturase